MNKVVKLLDVKNAETIMGFCNYKDSTVYSYSVGALNFVVNVLPESNVFLKEISWLKAEHILRCLAVELEREHTYLVLKVKDCVLVSS